MDNLVWFIHFGALVFHTAIYTSCELDRDFLQHVGGMEGNSFINILQTDIDTDEDENHNQPQIISHSPYYEFNELISTLTNSKR